MAACDADRVCAHARSATPLAALPSPSCNSVRSGARPSTSRESAARSSRSSARDTAPAPVPAWPPVPASAMASPAADQTSRETQTPRTGRSPASLLPVTDADNLRRLPPRDSFGHGSQNRFLYFHRPLHRGLRVRDHAAHDLLPSPPAKRTYHLLFHPDISSANDTDNTDKPTHG